jgi:heme/copper-type cytochrome/quinol oxidase subunit 3
MTAIARPRSGLTHTGAAMAVFLSSESVFFLTLILSFFYLRAEADPARLAGGELLNPPRAAVFTLCLIASSGTYWLAERSRERGSRRGLQLWLLLTVLLGVVFLGGQAAEYREAWADGLTIGGDLFGTQYYTMTGIHFLHVTAGIVMLLILAGLALWGGPHEPGVGALQPIGYYWHFVDVVWIVLFTVIYLIGA